ncbi:MAG: hypothetical protein FJY75_02645 [Candidatus Eisenbacteria bacterium]|uniref:Fibronectin type-III domain-containing protein n=1 Tax=Eiseniibacteriota bacterium TaxID=2212470 RepID=A0A938BN07_UNCEI|nr:hypothetical protein [Candidatus Eisenbacteria bacterium]
MRACPAGPRRRARLAAIAIAALLPIASGARGGPLSGDASGTVRPPVDWAVVHHPERGIPCRGWRGAAAPDAVHAAAQWATPATPLRDGGGAPPPEDLLPPGERLAVERFLARAAPWLGCAPADLLFSDRRAARRLAHIHLEQTFRGLPVEGARLALTLGPGNEILGFDSTIAAALGDPDLEARITPEGAQGLAAERAGAALRWTSMELALRPEPAGAPPRLVWRMRGRAEASRESWRALVDARTGEVLDLRALSLELSGEVAGLIHAPDPWGAQVRVPFPDLLVLAEAQGAPPESTHTDSLGRFRIEVPEGADPRVRIPLLGRYAEVRRGSWDAPPAEIVATAPADPLAALWDSSAASAAEREVYIHAAASRAWLQAIDPAFDAPLRRLDRPVPILAEDPALDCNALAHVDPEDFHLRFSGADAACTDLGRLRTVVAHEYGHLVTACAYAPDEAPRFIHEACSDYFAAAVSGTPLVGLGWRGPGTFVRDLGEPRYFPAHPFCAEDPYCSGGILATALWDLRRRLTAAGGLAGERYADSLFHFMRAGKPRDFDACLLHLLLQDDDDGDLANGTPNLAAVAGAFADHGLGDFGVTLFHRPLADTTASPGPRRVDLAVACVHPPDPESAVLHYRFDGGPFSRAAMEGAGYAYAGEIPGAPAGTRVDYYFTAADRTGRSERLPRDAPSGTFSYRVGPDTTPPAILHLAAASPVAGAPRFWIQAGAADNAGTVDSIWVEAIVSSPGEAGGSETGGDEAASTAATLHPKPLDVREAAGGPALPSRGGAYEGTLEASALAAGDRILLRLGARDAAGNTSFFPAEAPRELLVAAGWEEDFEDGPGEALLAGGWAWRGDPRPGAPRGAGPPAAAAPAAEPAEAGDPLRGDLAWPSGRAGLVFEGGGASHPPAATVTFPDRDLAGWDRASLVFWTDYGFEGFEAGGRLLASADGGATWAPVEPLGGYPAGAYYDSNGNGVPDIIVGAFGGDAGSGQVVRVPLDGWTGGSLRIRFEAFGARAPDFWRIDDVRLLRETALPPPTGLAATQGQARSVRLSWRRPQGAAGDPLGYELFRGEASRDYAALPAASLAHPAAVWTDSDVIAGRRYHYAVRALYPQGASALSDEAIGFPYAARLGAPAEMVSLTGSDDAGRDTLTITNLGTGELRVSVYCGTETDDWEDVRAIYRAGDAPPGGFRRVLSDPRDAPAPDIRHLSIAEASGSVIFRVGMHSPLPDPREAFTLLLLLDTDLSPETGLRQPNIGADFIVAVGRMVYRATEGLALGYVFDPRWNFVERTSAVSALEGQDSLEFAVRWSTLGNPPAIACALGILVSRDPPPLPPVWDGDLAPEPPRLEWLAYEPAAGVAAPGAPLPIVLSYDLAGAPIRTHRARLFLATNDALQPRATLPLSVRRPAQEAITLLRLAGPNPNPSSGGAGLTLEIPAGQAWKMAVVDVAGRFVRLLGRGGPGDAEARLLHWDGRTEEGTRAAAGRYYVVAQAGARQVARPLLLVP